MHTLVLFVLTTCFSTCLIFGFKEKGERIDEMIDEDRYPTSNDAKGREKSPFENKQTPRQVNLKQTAGGGDDGKLREKPIQTRLEGSSFSRRGQIARREVLTVPRKRRGLSFENLTPITKSPTSLQNTTSINVLTKAPSKGPFLPNCSSSFSCRGRCQKNRNGFNLNEEEKHFCYCDDYCEIFQDCCADFDMFCPLPNISVSSSASSHWNCHSELWMIDQCPQNWSITEVNSKCIAITWTLTMDNYVDVIPVVSRSGKTYRNRFCAQCHGEHNHDIEHYSLYFKECQLSPPQLQDYSTREALELLFEYCIKIGWQPKNGQLKRSCLNMYKKCYAPADVEVSEKCIQSPTRLLATEDTKKTYKNIYCAKCYMSDQEIKSLTCGPDNYDEPRGKPLAPFSLLMDIGDGKLATKFNSNNHQIKVSCLKSEVYDIFLELCRPSSHAPSTLISSHFDRYRLALWVTAGFTFASRIENYDTGNVTTFFGISLGLNLEDIEIKEIKQIWKLSILILEIRLEKRFGLRRSRRSYEQMSIGSLLNFTRPVRFVFQNNSFIIIKATRRLLTCFHVQYFTPEDYVVVHGSSSIYINQTQELLTEKQYSANSTKNHNGYLIPVGLIAVCRQHLPSTSSCNGTYISLDKDEYVMLPNNSVYRNASNTVYNQGEYSIINGSVVVCTEYSNKYTKTQPTDESQNDQALRILTCIGLSLSVVCLVIVLVTYLLFGELRTLPGINLMNLSSALLIAHLFWLIGSGQTGSHGACVAIAVILHYSFLASFAWMSIIAFNTWKIFSSMRSAGASSDNESRRKKTRCTLAVGWLPVLALVLICLALDQSGTVEIGYGGPNGCWINNGRANLFIFVLPVAASVVWNAVFFGLTVKAFRKVTEQTRMVKEHRDYNSVYVKIAVLMGFTWIFGFLAPFVSSYFLYPFVALNTIQGVYIAVCFTFTRRVKNLFVALISETKVDPRRSQPQGPQVRNTQNQSTGF